MSAVVFVRDRAITERRAFLASVEVELLDGRTPLTSISTQARYLHKLFVKGGRGTSWAKITRFIPRDICEEKANMKY
jgi:hypothetical protein